jgi:DNA-binding response OmpR family regulator
MTTTAVEAHNLTTIKVLVIGDDDDTGRKLVDGLKQSNMHTAWAVNAADGITLKKLFSPDIVLLDLKLPDCSSVDVINCIAQRPECGLIIVSGPADEADRVLALELGADDYIAKPPSLRELVARIRAVSRRVKQRPARRPETEPHASSKAGTLTIDPVNHAVHGANGARIAVTSAEYMALKALIDAKGEIVPRSRLSMSALNRPWRPENRSVDQLIYNLRSKLLAISDETQIISVRGAGYFIAPA